MLGFDIESTSRVGLIFLGLYVAFTNAYKKILKGLWRSKNSYSVDVMFIVVLVGKEVLMDRNSMNSFYFNADSLLY